MYEVLINSDNTTLFCKSKLENLKINDIVIIKDKKSLEIGKITKILKNDNKSTSSTIIRHASFRDKKASQKNKIDAQKAFIKCRELIKKLKLNMQLVNSYYTFDRSQLVFKFISEERVDFRNLACSLANIYKTRIELRQIGVRDKAKEIGGCGQCGRELCCKKFLSDFDSVSINMAKNQDIALNPNKINGICGRLLCCLKYENDCYKECRKKLPKIGSYVDNGEHKGKVVSLDVLKQKYSICTENKEIIECGLNESTK